MSTATPALAQPGSRREFLKTSSVLAGAAALGTLPVERSAHAAGSEVIRIGLIGGDMIPWEEAMQSKRSFALPRYGWDIDPPVRPDPDGRYPTAMQGKGEAEKWQM